MNYKKNSRLSKHVGIWTPPFLVKMLNIFLQPWFDTYKMQPRRLTGFRITFVFFFSFFFFFNLAAHHKQKDARVTGIYTNNVLALYFVF